MGYASNTGTRRNLEALRRCGWRILLTPSKPQPPVGFRFAIDNGAWSCHVSGRPFNERGFMRLVEQHASAADFVVIPDIVAGGMHSFSFSMDWLPRLYTCKHLLFALQDGMDPLAVGELLKEYSKVGLFLGGTTEWKLREMYGWGMVAAALGRWLHVGRVNTRRRLRLCAEAGATSFDGTSASMFSCTVPLLDASRRQPNLFAPTNREIAEAAVP